MHDWYTTEQKFERHCMHDACSTSLTSHNFLIKKTKFCSVNNYLQDLVSIDKTVQIVNIKIKKVILYSKSAAQ